MLQVASLSSLMKKTNGDLFFWIFYAIERELHLNESKRLFKTLMMFLSDIVFLWFL